MPQGIERFTMDRSASQRRTRTWGAGLSPRYLLTKEFAVRAHADKPQDFIVWLFVDRQEIRFQMTLAMVLPVARQGMIAVFLLQRLVIGQQDTDLRE